jgi:hypothetical protein
MDIQKKLDEWLAANEDAQKYIARLYYLSGEGEVPKDVTHTVQMESVTAPEREFTVGIAATQQGAILFETLLALLATNPSA